MQAFNRIALVIVEQPRYYIICDIVQITHKHTDIQYELNINHLLLLCAHKQIILHTTQPNMVLRLLLF